MSPCSLAAKLWDTTQGNIYNILDHFADLRCINFNTTKETNEPRTNEIPLLARDLLAVFEMSFPMCHFSHLGGPYVCHSMALCIHSCLKVILLHSTFLYPAGVQTPQYL